MSNTIFALNDAYNYIENACNDINHPKVQAMLEAIDNAIDVIEKAQRINEKLTQMLTQNEIA